MRNYLTIYSEESLHKYYLSPSTHYHIQDNNLYLFNSLTFAELYLSGESDKLQNIVNHLLSGVDEDTLLSLLSDLKNNYSSDHLIMLLQKGVIE
jgi:hypothetical protein